MLFDKFWVGCQPLCHKSLIEFLLDWLLGSSSFIIICLLHNRVWIVWPWTCRCIPFWTMFSYFSWPGGLLSSYRQIFMQNYNINYNKKKKLLLQNTVNSVMNDGQSACLAVLCKMFFGVCSYFVECGQLLISCLMLQCRLAGRIFVKVGWDNELWLQHTVFLQARLYGVANCAVALGTLLDTHTERCVWL